MIRLFAPEIYIKSGATGVTSFTTQELLTTALASWMHLYGSETGATLTEEKGQTIVLSGGQTKATSKKITGSINFLEVTPDNYTALRALRNVACSIIFNEVYTQDGGTPPSGKAYQVQNVLPKVKLIAKSNDLFRIAISFEKEGDLSNVIEEYDLT